MLASLPVATRLSPSLVWVSEVSEVVEEARDVLTLAAEKDSGASSGQGGVKLRRSLESLPLLRYVRFQYRFYCVDLLTVPTYDETSIARF